MRLRIPYGTKTIAVRVPDSAALTIAEPQELPDEAVDLAVAVERPVAGPPLLGRLEGGRKVLVVVNDTTRSTPTASMLDALLPLLDDKDVTVAVATGAHAPPTREEMQTIFGPRWRTLMDAAVIHDAERIEDVTGRTTSYGTPVAANPVLDDTDAVVVLTSVEPHFTAGFTGGRKSLVPGLAAFRTIEMNHRLAIRDGSDPLRLDGNPLNEDLEEALDLLDLPVFCVNGVLDGGGRLVHASCGDPRESLRAAARVAAEVYAPVLDEPADIVVAVATPPLDRDLYQAQKAVENVKWAVREGGIIILVSRCWTGVGPAFYARTLADLSHDRLDPERVFHSYRLGDHKPVRMARLLERNEVWGVTEAPQEALKSAMVRPFSGLQHAVDTALQAIGSEARVLWVPKASVTTPVCARVRRAG